MEFSIKLYGKGGFGVSQNDVIFAHAYIHGRQRYDPGSSDVSVMFF